MRELNWAGHSVETIAAEYETDAALAEVNNDMNNSYFQAAFRAEFESREIDAQQGEKDGQ
ncbi:hypothetical protein ACWIG4_30235 [Streptomyces sp. NPDC002248]